MTHKRLFHMNGIFKVIKFYIGDLTLLLSRVLLFIWDSRRLIHCFSSKMINRVLIFCCGCWFSQRLPVLHSVEFFLFRDLKFKILKYFRGGNSSARVKKHSFLSSSFIQLFFVYTQKKLPMEENHVTFISSYLVFFLLFAKKIPNFGFWLIKLDLKLIICHLSVLLFSLFCDTFICLFCLRAV